MNWGTLLTSGPAKQQHKRSNTEADVEDQLGLFVQWASDLTDRPLLRDGSLSTRLNVSGERVGDTRLG